MTVSLCCDFVVLCFASLFALSFHGISQEVSRNERFYVILVV